ncbi:glucose-1-phosphate thymidylyltransferase [Deinococcus roseus]|uniref:Glucose-1-phosphate thymidylyltransferase n=1 Tax=Deinococcus roseus TaxID=392414 RepID=A0ABQ2CZ44_9DEIO|nr:glucose-1-phosphate thymidylyltransferase [Deinococcus roseus]GGJ35370.1 glucose-1-phosphate thymidylyltransferase [Deinococcus roseus]
MKGLILSGGKGTRLRPLTHTRAKQLVPIGNRANLDYAVDDLSDMGIRDIVVVISPETGTEVQNHLGDGSAYGVNFTYVLQDQPLGLAHAVKTARPHLGEEPFVMYLGDNLLTGGIGHLLEAYHEGETAACILLTEVPNPQSFGVAVLDEQGQISRLIEKPAEYVSPWALVGVYLFTPLIHKVIETLQPSPRGELEITDAIQGLIDWGFTVRSEKVRGWWKDTGKPEDLLDANRLVLSRLERNIAGTVEESELVGEIEIAAGAVVRNSRLRGPISIAAGAVIENAYVGPYTSIGQNAVVKDAEVEYSILMQGAQIRHLSRRLDASILGEEAWMGGRSRKSHSYQVILGDRSSVVVDGE